MLSLRIYTFDPTPTGGWRESPPRDVALPSEGTVTIGRAWGADVLLNDDLASRLHAAIDVRRDAIEIKDLNSRHGVIVNGTACAHARLALGDQVRIGRTVVVLVSSAFPPAPPPVSGSSGAPSTVVATPPRRARCD